MTNTTKTWAEAIEMAIVELGYIATLKDIYQLAPKYKGSFNGKTPNNTINERVQRNDNFIKLKPGLYGLKNHLDKLPDEFNPNVEKTEADEIIITHSYMQGLLLEIGNMQGYKTFTPDKSGLFVKKKLDEIMGIKEVPKFTFDKIIQTTKYIDVIWFNERNFPYQVFEVEHSTNFINSLVKFTDLQEFRVKMTIVAPERRKKFEQEKNRFAFEAISDRVEFYSYDQVEKEYKKLLK